MSGRRTGLVATAVIGLAMSGAIGCRSDDAVRPPNVILILADDMGFGDVGSYGGDPADTPHLDRLAAEGMRLDRFYLPTSACSPTRAAILTGRYPLTVGIPNVLGPRARIGLDTSLVTIAEVFRANSYVTAAVGKWHLGDHPSFLPTAHGFDSWFGLPYSNDMSPDPANNPRDRARRHPPLPLIRDTTVVEREPDQRHLTQRYLDHALDVIRENADRPFFLYFAHSDPHVPLFPGPAFAGSSPNGTYGDVLREVDASVGAIRDVLQETGLAERTMVFFTSDNGPWLAMGNHAGSAGPLREGKATAFEGGHRVPAIAWWPGRVPAGSTTERYVSALDLLPTLSAAAELRVPQAVRTDGHDRWSVLQGLDSAEPDTSAFYYYRGGGLHAVRQGRWKLHVPHAYPSMEAGTPGRDGQPGSSVRHEIGPALFDLWTDPGERNDVIAEYPDVVARLVQAAERGRTRFGDRITDRTGRLQQAPGRVSRVWAEQTGNSWPIEGGRP